MLVFIFYSNSGFSMPNSNDPDKLPAKFVQAAQPAADYVAERQAAMDAMADRHQAEYDDVHDGSGRSEEFPSDLDARQAEERQRFERQWPVQQTPASPAPAVASPKPPGP